jgi:hypothetical protein
MYLKQLIQNEGSCLKNYDWIWMGLNGLLNVAIKILTYLGPSVAIKDACLIQTSVIFMWGWWRSLWVVKVGGGEYSIVSFSWEWQYIVIPLLFQHKLNYFSFRKKIKFLFIICVKILIKSNMQLSSFQPHTCYDNDLKLGQFKHINLFHNIDKILFIILYNH